MNKKFEEIIDYIVNQSIFLKNKYTNETNIPVEFVCIFCQSNDEYEELTKVIERLGKTVQDTLSGSVYLLSKPLETKAGFLSLIKIRKPDQKRKERGDTDFNTDYPKFKERYFGNQRFELIKRDNFEMLRLADPQFKVMVCFSSVPQSKLLGINPKVGS